MKRSRWLTIREETRRGLFMIRVEGAHHRQFDVEVRTLEGELRWWGAAKSRRSARWLGIRKVAELQHELDMRESKRMAKAMLGGEP